MEIETRFSNGDKVVPISWRYEEQFVRCVFCGGTGTVNGANNASANCPKCYGRKGENKWLPKKWQIGQQMTIGQVRVCITGEWEGSSDLFTNYGKQKYSVKEEYMCRETGIGSGSVWDGNNLFSTLEEAQAECAKRNQKEQS